MFREKKTIYPSNLMLKWCGNCVYSNIIRMQKKKLMILFIKSLWAMSVLSTYYMEMRVNNLPRNHTMLSRLRAVQTTSILSNSKFKYFEFIGIVCQRISVLIQLLQHREYSFVLIDSQE